jgi:hypothetical protein
MPKNIILVHGYSVRTLDTYGMLPQLLANDGFRPEAIFFRHLIHSTTTLHATILPKRSTSGSRALNRPAWTSVTRVSSATRPAL